MVIPKVFISYSHDSPEHKGWVLSLAIRLRKNGIDVVLDQWDLGPGGDLPEFMEKNLKDSDKIIAICTERYVQKANAGEGGVGYEKMIITSDLIRKINSEKVIPVVRQKGTFQVPIFLETKKYVDFSEQDNFEFGYDELVRKIHNAPLYEKPPIGYNPFPSSEELIPEKVHDPLKDLMTILVSDYEAGKSYVSLSILRQRLGISRIMFEILVDEAHHRGLVEYNYGYDSITLGTIGKRYALENKLVDNV